MGSSASICKDEEEDTKDIERLKTYETLLKMGFEDEGMCWNATKKYGANINECVDSLLLSQSKTNQKQNDEPQQQMSLTAHNASQTEVHKALLQNPEKNDEKQCIDTTVNDDICIDRIIKALLQNPQKNDEKQCVDKTVNEDICVSAHKCSSIDRIIKALQFMNDHKNSFEEINEYYVKNRKIQSDFHHILMHHLSAKEAEYALIYNIIHNKLVMNECELEQCASFHRNNRNRGETMKTDNLPPNMQYIDILDEIHCYFLHSYDCGFRIKSQDLKVDEQKDDDVLSEYKVDKTLIKMKNILESKRANLVKIRGNYRMKHNKFVIQIGDGIEHKHEETEETEETEVTEVTEVTEDTEDTEPTKSDNIFWGGINFHYWSKSATRHGRGHYVPSIYASLKDEILNNKTHVLNINEWKRVIAKVEEKLRSTQFQKVKITDKWVGEYFGIAEGSNLSHWHVLSIMLYTDYDKLQSEFSKTFRFMPSDYNDIESVIKRNQQFAIWSKCLKECVKCFGTQMADIHYNKAFYTGLLSVMPVSAFNISLVAPTSTSLDLCVASMFAVTGCILQFTQHIGATKFFNTSWISCFPLEDERFFMADDLWGGGVRISSIRIIEKGQHFTDEISKMCNFNNMMVKMGVWDYDDDVPFIKSMIDHYDTSIPFKNKYPVYINESFKAFMKNVKKININFNYTRFSTCTDETRAPKGYESLFFAPECRGLLKFSYLFKLFENCNSISVLNMFVNMDEHFIKLLLIEIERIGELMKRANTQTPKRIELDARTLHNKKFDMETFQTLYGSQFQNKNCVLKYHHGHKLCLEIQPTNQ